MAVAIVALGIQGMIVTDVLRMAIRSVTEKQDWLPMMLVVIAEAALRVAFLFRHGRRH